MQIIKKYSPLLLLLFLFGCEDNVENIHRYSKIISQYRNYPVYLDMSEIGNIQVKSNSQIENPFKILSNEFYYFVGDMLKGVHVYEKEATGVDYLCFIECKYIKDFELAGDKLFGNNLVDLVVIDISNPLDISTLHRQKNYFNKFTGVKEYWWNIPYDEEKGLVVKWEYVELSGMVTEEQPNLDFSEYDQLYGNLQTTAIPDDWFSSQPEFDKPYVGMINAGTDEIYSYGSYNSWSICSYQSGVFSTREEDLWTNPRGNYAPPYYYSNAFPTRLFFEDDIIYNLGKLELASNGYCDCILYNENYPVDYSLYFPDFLPQDITYMPTPTMDAFYVLTGQSIQGVFITGNGIPEFSYITRDYPIQTDAGEILTIGDHLVTLGNELSVYSASEDAISLIKEYPEISGICCKKEENHLVVANTQGLFIYDISNLENIQLIQ
jgi:hypothetical protein